MPPTMNHDLFEQLLRADKTLCWHGLFTPHRCPRKGTYRKAKKDSYASVSHQAHWLDAAVWCLEHSQDKPYTFPFVSAKEGGGDDL